MKTKDVHLLVLDTLSDWEPGFAIAYLNEPAPGMPSRYRVQSVGLSREPVVTKGGLVGDDDTLSALVDNLWKEH